MSQEPVKFNMAEIEALLKTDPQTQDFFERKTVCDYDSFVRVLHKDILRAIKEIQHDRQQFQGANFGEDAISSLIIKCLKFLNYDAEHDTQHGGHCDILVKHNALGFEWIGEAKLWKGQSYIKDGLEQLLTRYATGIPSESAGGMLVYVKQPDTASKLKTWHQELSSHSSTVSLDPLPDELQELHFNSVQKVTSSGLNYKLVSYFVSLNHATSTEPEYDEHGNEIAA